MNLAKILIAEDDPNFGLVLKSFLSLNDFAVTLCEDGNKALMAFKTNTFDLCILDVMMPNRDGFDVAKRIQQSGEEVPIVFLTAKGLKEDQIKGYNLGAIDYLVKPFDPDILLLKIQAILKRRQASYTENVRYQIGRFSFQPTHRLLIFGGTQWQLSPKESDLLYLLCQKPGEVLLRKEALTKIWQEDNFFTAQSMNVYITKLRKYFQADQEYGVQIKNLHSKGFLLLPVAKQITDTEKNN